MNKVPERYFVAALFCALTLQFLPASTDAFAAGRADAKKVEFYWGSCNERLYRYDKPPVSGKPFSYTVWKGERSHATAIIYPHTDLQGLSVSFDDLKCGSRTISASCLSARFERSVMADEFEPGYCQCSKRAKLNLGVIQVFDVLDTCSVIDLAQYDYAPVWITASVPSDAVAGKYSSRIHLSCGGRRIASLPFSISVADRQLPSPRDWSFHLDLWQNPYSVARYNGVPLWSKEHFEAMKPVMKILADAGQKVITTTLTHRPWNAQTQDPYGSMVVKVKRADGSWMYDYSVFDAWVEFMMGLGIDRQINCYTLVSAASRYDYFDAASSTHKVVVLPTGSKEYKEIWAPFLIDFAEHLKEKGWFEKTTLAMDEIDVGDMVAVVDFVHATVPGFRLTLAGELHPEVEQALDDLSVTFRSDFPSDVRARRTEEGKISTFYTCCNERFPNTFLPSHPVEAAWLPAYAAAYGFDGFLRWAYNSWTEDPLVDTRFRAFAAGDCFLVYPGGLSSVRMEMLTAGIQLYEKVRILRSTLDPAALSRLEDALSAICYDTLPDQNSEDDSISVSSVLSQMTGLWSVMSSL